MAIAPLTPTDWLNSAKLPGTPGLYFMGVFNRRITFYSQQVRALRLVHAIDTLNLIKPGQRVAIVGAGAAGVTAAVGLALLGKDVTLYDPADTILQLQSASPRLLHPHIYEWPSLGSLNDQAGLPVLDWTSGTGGDVCNALQTEFEIAMAGALGLQRALSRTLEKVEKVASGWRLTFQNDVNESPKVYQHVLLAMGFGDEKPCGATAPVGYWKLTGVGTAAVEPVANTSYLVSGNGDGALTELLNLCITDFDHVTFTKMFLGMLLPYAEQATSAVAAVFANQPPKADVEASLTSHLRPILDEHGVLERLRPLLRTDRVVSANSKGPLFAAGQAAQLNQCMAYAVLEAAKLEERPVHRTSGKVTDTVAVADGTTVTGIADGNGSVTTAFKHVILRHGPDKQDRYEPVKDTLAAYKAHAEALFATNAAFDAPPVLSNEIYDFFAKLWIEKLADQASKEGLKQQALQEQASIVISRDPVAGIIVERGARSLGQIAEECERLATPFRVQVDIDPSELDAANDLLRIARASNGKIELRAAQPVFEAWRKLQPNIAAGSATLPRFRPDALDHSSLSTAIDNCLLRYLDAHVSNAVTQGGCAPLGTINATLLSAIATTWSAWRTSLIADSVLRFDFLRWLANVVQDQSSPWDGDHGHLRALGNAIVMMLATHHGEPLVPARMIGGNLQFATEAVALGSGCAAIGLDSISVRKRPEDWGVDALIMSATGDIEIQEAGGVADAGVPGTSMKVARRVKPAVIQNSDYWRGKLAGSIADWKAAVEAEFAAFRERQNKAVEEVSG